MTEETPSGAETAIGVAETATVEVSEAATAAPGKCTRLSVLTVVLRPKFRSSQQKDGRFTAENAFQNTENSEFKYSLEVLFCKDIQQHCSLFSLCFLPYAQVKGMESQLV
jgi:hypothetical protein